MKFSIASLCIILFSLLSCKQNTYNYRFSKTEPVIVYKTKADYYHNVPVLLNNDKSKIISYPATTDLYYKGELALPIKLHNNYLLDNRGIGKNVAFLKYTYEEYSKLKEIPKLTDLYSLIIDKDPLLEIYNCGSRNTYKNVVTEINSIIDKNNLSQFKSIAR